MRTGNGTGDSTGTIPGDPSTLSLGRMCKFRVIGRQAHSFTQAGSLCELLGRLAEGSYTIDGSIHAPEISVPPVARLSSFCGTNLTRAC
jgi:hypothetical protein